ncbi:hypothetical protein [Lentzea kentuckyensis]|uniref:hypothetical protein n=1 Tax=Lentzea kentuckyensis TaxID=360086 RepID=UPI000A3C8AFE|nr:hypothetical protein [Lentzea kentuckyensis]
MSTLDPATVELTFTNGFRHLVPAFLAARVRGIDSDGDLLVPLCDRPSMLRDDHTEYLVPLTPCCRATGKGAECSTGVVCRSCFEEVGIKYGLDGQIVAEVSLMTPVKSGPLAVRVAVVRPGSTNAYVVTKEIHVGARLPGGLLITAIEPALSIDTCYDCAHVFNEGAPAVHVVQDEEALAAQRDVLHLHCAQIRSADSLRYVVAEQHTATFAALRQSVERLTQSTHRSSKIRNAINDLSTAFDAYSALFEN